MDDNNNLIEDGYINENLQQYESSLEKYKDERDAIQKKTFTKWVNKHLIKVRKGVVDLFKDLRNGTNLLALLEVLSGEILPREKGNKRIHKLQNVKFALDFLRKRMIKLVNIRADDIVDGNPKLTLGLVWTIILHFQLSEIVVHDDDLSFREALLRWAQKTTEGYPGCRVTDFTHSWRDGLAFNAILHRNRPDLLDYHQCRERTNRENLRNAFYIADKDLGVTPLLDPEDVDRPQPDEKSLITYISSLYELFPNPPERNPLYDNDKIKRIDEYRELAKRLCVWMKENIAKLRQRNFPNNYQEMKIVQQENNRFRTQEIPPKQHDKQRLSSSYKEVIQMAKSLPGYVPIEEEYRIDNIEQQWNKLISAHQERERAINEEMDRLEKLHRLAEKLIKDIKQCDRNLDNIERDINEEEKRVQRLHPLEGKFNIDKIEADLRQEGDNIKNMFKDVQTLRDGRYPKANDLQTRVEQLHKRWSDMKLDFKRRVVDVLNARREEALRKPLTEEDLINSNPSFRFLYDCIQWVQERLKKLEGLDYGHDLQSVQSFLEQHKSEHRTIDQFQSKVDQCDDKKNQFKGEEYDIYVRMLNRLHKGYSELLVVSNKRLSDLDALLDFIQSATQELKWLADKEDVEISRDWSSRNINYSEAEQTYKQVVNEVERREHQFKSVLERGESLLRQKHPATKCIEGLINKMQTQWSWLLGLINTQVVHAKNSSDSQQFFNESKEFDQWLTRTEDKVNKIHRTQYSSIEEGERLLNKMNQFKQEIAENEKFVKELIKRSKDVSPIKQRKEYIRQPIKARSLCVIKQERTTVTKNETVTLHDNSSKAKWRITTSSGAEISAPGVCFVIPPPDQEAIDTANELKRRYDQLNKEFANAIDSILKQIQKLKDDEEERKRREREEAERRAREEAERRAREEAERRAREEAERRAREEAERKEKERRAAIMDKFRQCEDGLRQLNSWLSQVEQNLANLGPVREQIEELKRQISQAQEIKGDLESHKRQVETTIENSISIAKQGEDFMNREDIRRIHKDCESVKKRYDSCCDHSNRLLSRLNASFEELSKFRQEFSSFNKWLESAERSLNEMEKALKSGKDTTEPLRELANEVHSKESNLRFIEKCSQRFLETSIEYLSSLNEFRSTLERRMGPVSAPESRLKSEISELIDRYNKLVDRLKSLNDRMSGLGDKQREFADAFDKANRWLSGAKKDAKRLLDEQIPAEPRAIQNQMDKVRGMLDNADSQGRPVIDKAKSAGRSLLDALDQIGVSPSERRPIEDGLRKLDDGFKDLLKNLNDRERNLDSALAQAGKFQDSLASVDKWLSDIENMVRNQKPISSDYNKLKPQLEEQKEIKKMLIDGENGMNSLNNMGKDFMKNLDSGERAQVEKQLNGLNKRYDRLRTGCQTRLDAIEKAIPLARTFAEKIAQLTEWLKNSERKLQTLSTNIPTDENLLRRLIAEHRSLHDDIVSKKRDFDELTRIGQNLIDLVDDNEAQIIVDQCKEVTERYAKLVEDSLALNLSLNKSLQEALLYSGQFKLAYKDLMDWLEKAIRELSQDKPLYGDLDTVQALVDEHKRFQKELEMRSNNLKSVRKTANKLLETASADDSRNIRDQMNSLDSKWDECTRLSEQKTRKLEDALRQAKELHKSVDALLKWLSDAETKLRSTGPLPDDEETTRRQLEEHERFMREMRDIEKNKDATISLAKEIVHKSHPNAIPVIRHWITLIESRWEKVSQLAQQREQRLRDHLNALRGIMELLEELLRWLIGKESELSRMEAQPLPNDTHALVHMIDDLQSFIDDLSKREPDIEKVAKAFSAKRGPTRESPTKGRTKGRTPSPTRDQVEPEIRNPRARELMEKWRSVWKRAMDRMKQLQDHLIHNKEREGLKERDWNFDEWRRRFLDWMNNQKMRILDFFRDLDKLNEGRVPIPNFIDGFLESDFPTNQPEMERVADIFDRNKDRYIDQDEWLTTLRPKTEYEIIEDEVQRQVALCTCPVRYKVFSVGEGKYRFGASQKLRLVRILRSCVMVRVGGGWVSLEEFLMKNDPCRAKGRTNLELREQFVLAEGVSQAMQPFISKPAVRDGTYSKTGPITKVREYTQRSVPMSKDSPYRFGNETSDYSFSDQAESPGTKSRSLSRLTYGSTGRKLGPGSRDSSDISGESIEGYQQSSRLERWKF